MATVFNATIQDQFGNTISGAAITVKIDDASGAMATLYSDEEGLVPLANPFTSEADGLAQFWADAGAYYIEVASGGETSDGWAIELGGVGGTEAVTLTEAVAIGDAVTFDGALVAGATIDEVAGLSSSDGGIGDSINALKEGNFTLGTWAWTPDEFVYLDAAGALTQTPPATEHRRIGIATTATTIAVRIDPTVREVGGAGSENAIPALDDAGLLDHTMIDKAAAGGAGAEDILVQANGSGEIDADFLAQALDNSRDFTASGVITAGDPVTLTGNKTVQTIEPIAGAFGWTDEGDFTAEFGVTLRSTPQNNYYVAADPTRDVFLVTYSNSGNQSFLQAFTYSGGVFTKGTALNLGFGVGETALEYHPVEDCFIFVRNSSIYVVTLSGLAVTISASQGSLTAAGSRVSIGCSSVDNTFVISGGVNSIAGTVSGAGATITLGAQSSHNATSTAPSVDYNPDGDNYVVVYSDPNTVPDSLRAKVITLTGTTISFGAEAVVYSLSDPLANSFFAMGPNGVGISSYMNNALETEYAPLSISGTTITVGTTVPATITAANERGQGIRYAPLSDNFVTAQGSNGVALGVWVGTLSLSGSTITIDNEVVTTMTSAVGQGDIRAIIAMGATEAFFFINSSTTTIDMGFINPATPTFNNAGFIGFSEETVADTETVKISTPTRVNTSQSGLTFGSTYYLLNDGALSTTDTDGNGAVGFALSATKLLNTKDFA